MSRSTSHVVFVSALSYLKLSSSLQGTKLFEIFQIPIEIPQKISFLRGNPTFFIRNFENCHFRLVNSKEKHYLCRVIYNKMMSYEQFWQPLTVIYEAGEAKAIARLVLEKRYGLTMADVLCGRAETIDSNELSVLQQRLLTGEPVQYALGEAEFYGRSFHVESGVLIPRPETAELCQWIIASDEHGLTRASKKTVRDNPCSSEIKILDIGTGSGCIACTLAAELPQAQVTAWDISAEALLIAQENAKRTNVHVQFEQVDILITHYSIPVTPYDIIVSNPPYICEKERGSMDRNVVEHEPEVALFVPDDDPLLFYRAIARYAQEALNTDGCLYFEINPLYLKELTEMLHQTGFSHVESKDDQFGKTRFIRACK